MTTGTILFIGITAVMVGDILVAFYFRRLADRAESGERVRVGFDPVGARRVAGMLLVFAPLIWLIMTLIAFGVVPSGIDPVQF